MSIRNIVFSVRSSPVNATRANVATNPSWQLAIILTIASVAGHQVPSPRYPSRFFSGMKVNASASSRAVQFQTRSQNASYLLSNVAPGLNQWGKGPVLESLVGAFGVIIVFYCIDASNTVIMCYELRVRPRSSSLELLMLHALFWKIIASSEFILTCRHDTNLKNNK